MFSIINTANTAAAKIPSRAFLFYSIMMIPVVLVEYMALRCFDEYRYTLVDESLADRMARDPIPGDESFISYTYMYIYIY
jgi:hypothetical protein